MDRFDSFDDLSQLHAIETQQEVNDVPEEQWLLESYMKTVFTGEWIHVQIRIESKSLTITSIGQELEILEKLNTRKIKNSTIVKDAEKIGNYNPPSSKQPSPIILIDYVDKSVYLMPDGGLGDCNNIKSWIDEGQYAQCTLLDQQLTKEDIPVILDKCLKFITSQGCLTTGIYRIAGVNRRIEQLLEDFRRNAWDVDLNSSQYTEHDVANVIKRFFRTLNDPLLTQDLRSLWVAATVVEDEQHKLNMYRNLLADLPELNYKTLRRLIVHLRNISEQNEHNKMPASNLAALWGPTILNVDGMPSLNFNEVAVEVGIISCLMEHFYSLFEINEEEIQQEKDRLQILREDLEGISRKFTGNADIKVMTIS